MVPAIEPDETLTLQHLQHITSRWDELGEPAVLELRFLTADDDTAFKNTQHFPPTPNGLDMAAKHAAAMNALHLNAYVVVNPIRGDISTNRTASDNDIVASFYHWADADDETAAANARQFVGPKPTLAMLTGSKPSNRIHVYWELEEPTRNLDAWTATQRAIAATLKSDPAVINPSRIMRVAGTVNWPKPKKQAKGYVPELVRMHAYSDDERPPVPAEQMRRAFAGAAQSAPVDGFPAFDLGPQPMDREQARIQALSGEEWHHAVIRLVGSYVAKGMSDAEIHTLTDPLTLAGYTVEQTRREVQTAIDGARAKGWTPEAPQSAGTAAMPIISNLTIQTSAEFLHDLEPPTYIVDGILQSKRLHTLTGYTGHGKTTLTLNLAIAIGKGGFFGKAECEKGSTLFLAGENPDNVKWQYAAALAAQEIKPDEIPIHFLPSHFQLSTHIDALMARAAEIPNLRLIVIDSLQSFFEGDNDNDNMPMLNAARRFRVLNDLPSGPSVVVIAHPSGKKADKDNLVPRGGSSFMNEIDGNFTVWAEADGTQTFHYQGKHRGAPFEPEQFVMEERQFAHLHDHHGEMLRLKVTRVQIESERMNAAERRHKRDREILQYVKDRPELGVRGIGSAMGVSKSTVARALEEMAKDRLTHLDARKWKILPGGEEYLRDGGQDD